MRATETPRAGTRGASRIVIIAPAPPPYGGMALQARALAERLAADGMAAQVLPTNPRLPAPLAGVPGLRTLVQSGIYTTALLRVLRHAEVIHILAASHFYFWARVVPALLLGRLTGRRVVLNYRGGEAARFFAAYRALVVPLIRLASVITVPSPFLKRTFAEYDLETLTVPNVLDLGRFSYRRRGALQPRLLVTRNLEPMYNVKMALRAYEIVRLRYPGATLDVLGSGSEEDALRAWAQQRRLDNVRFHGAVAHDCIPEHLDKADILLNPTNVDNLPLSLLEAFAAGVAVVTTDAGGIPDLVGDSGAALVVAAGDAEKMAARVLELIGDSGLAARTLMAARQLAEKYAWDSVRAELLRAYYPAADAPQATQAMESRTS